MAIVITGVEKPKKCKECKLFCGHYSDVCCMVTGYNLDRKAVEETVPEWCPISEVPKKRVHVPRSVENPEYVDGFNACVGILNGENEPISREINQRLMRENKVKDIEQNANLLMEIRWLTSNKLLSCSEYTRINEIVLEAVERLEKEMEEKNGKS